MTRNPCVLRLSTACFRSTTSALLYWNVRNGYGQVRCVGRRRETRRTGNGYRPRWTGRRRQGARRHPRGRNDLRARQARRHQERPSQKQDRRPPREKRLLGEPSPNWRLAGVQKLALVDLSERKNSPVVLLREIAQGKRRKQQLCGEMRRVSGGPAPKRKTRCRSVTLVREARVAFRTTRVLFCLFCLFYLAWPAR